jgi:hypothetical protein
MFVNERGGYDGSQQSLWLLQAIPRSWMKRGVPISAKDVGTHFGGRVSIERRIADDGSAVTVQVRLDLGVLPAETRLRLRSADGTPLKSAEIDGTAAEILDGDTIRLPQKRTAEYRISGHFR